MPISVKDSALDETAMAILNSVKAIQNTAINTAFIVQVLEAINVSLQQHTVIIQSIANSLGALDQSEIDAVAADLRDVTSTLSAATERNKDT